MSIEEFFDSLEEMVDKVEDYEKAKDFYDRIQRCRRGEYETPMELAELLNDILDEILNKVPLGPYGEAIKMGVRIMKGALEAGVAGGMGIVWQCYKTRRAAGFSHEEAAAYCTQDDAMRRCLRLKWLEHTGALDESLPDDAEDEAGLDEPEPTDDSGQPTVTFEERRAWHIMYNDCCSTDDHGTQVPRLDFIGTPATEPAVGGGNQQWFTFTVEASHPCGIARIAIIAYTKAPQQTQFVKLQRQTSNFSTSSEEIEDGYRKVARVLSAGEVRIIVKARSNCETVTIRTL